MNTRKPTMNGFFSFLVFHCRLKYWPFKYEDMNSANPRNVLVTIANRKPDSHAEVGSSDLQATTEAQMDIVGHSSSNIPSHSQPLYYHTVSFFPQSSIEMILTCLLG